MKSEFWRRRFKRIHAWTSANSVFAEDLLKVSRDHRAKDFPNPSREGCAPFQARLSAFGRGEMPVQEERAHILSCSDCFAEYQTAIAEYRATVSSSDKRVTHGLLIPALACAVFLILAGTVIWQVYINRDDKKEPAQAFMTPTPQATALPSPIPSRSGSPGQTYLTPEVPNSSPTSLAAVHRMTIDFENAQALRRLAPEQSPIIKLSPVRQILFIKLPEGSPRGPYKVTLNNPFGKSIRFRTATSFNGKSVTVHFNLFGIPPARYSICVTRMQEVPSCLPVTIAKQ